MEIKIDRNSRIPLYLQIKEQFKELIQGNHLKKGLQLPTERELSLKLEVSRNTVSMAYKAVSYTHLDVYKRQQTNCYEDIESKII